MTLEEKAEQYVIKNVCENCNHCQSKGYIGCDTYRFAKKTYIDSAEENGMVCHDLRKNPNDLPKDSKEVLIITSDNRKHIGFYDNGWYCSECSGIVIAWYEPQFKE